MSFLKYLIPASFLAILPTLSFAASANLDPSDGVGITFWIISIAMVAATVFFLMESLRVKGKWRTSLVVGALVTLVAAVHYFYMRDVWVSTGASPTVFRYVDWIITVPLQMIEFYLILAACTAVAGGVFWRLFLGSLVMLIGGYLGDITGAFDRVCKEYLLAKLCNAGVGPLYLNFLDSYLQPRKAQVVVEGNSSDEMTIANTVFQGTVLGPPLWNLFFNDVSVPAASTGGDPSVFADDLNAFQQFGRQEPNEEIKRTMGVCRDRVHKWGRANRVSFDPAKEHLVVIHPVHGEGEAFKLLGCMMDCKLLMNQAVEKFFRRYALRLWR